MDSNHGRPQTSISGFQTSMCINEHTHTHIHMYTHVCTPRKHNYKNHRHWVDGIINTQVSLEGWALQIRGKEQGKKAQKEAGVF